MKNKIHYADNLYYITEMIKVLQNGMTLNLDEDYFLNKVVDDIFFIDKILTDSFNNLKSNKHLLKRNEYFRTLIRAKKQYLKLIETLVSETIHLAEALAPYSNRLHEAKIGHEKELIEIQFILNGEKAEVSEDLVSEEEFQFLMNDPEE